MRVLMNAADRDDDDKQWYGQIRQKAWKVAVLDRLYRVEEDVRRAISAAGWTLTENGGKFSISASTGQPRSALMDEAQAVVDATFTYISRAKKCLKPPDRWWCRYWDALARESLMPAYINLHAAETSRTLLLSSDQLMAVLPSIRRRAAAYLQLEDPCRVALDSVPDLTATGPQTLTRMRDDIVSSMTAVYQKVQAPVAELARAGAGSAADQTAADAPDGHGGYAAPGANGTGARDRVPVPSGDQAPGLTTLTGLLGRDQLIAAEAMGEACKSEDLQQFQVSRFRRMLLGTFMALLVLVVFMGIVGNIKPGYFPLCLAEEGAKGIMICPTGGHSPGGADLPLILGLGAIGASLAVSTSLARQKVAAGVRYSLSVAQGLLKVAFGALTAVLGIIILGTQTGNVPGILGTQAGLLTAAVVFGYSQEIFTRVIDKQADSLLDAASPSTSARGRKLADTPLTGAR
jgi:hypothetical protein